MHFKRKMMIICLLICNLIRSTLLLLFFYTCEITFKAILTVAAGWLGIFPLRQLKDKSVFG